ncbi:metalloregulator ArsR/SmtB family transcription factor [Gordonia sp. PKS22-38]|uniref:Metalloregulator ArsR/SmtB family transcription factor n=1 Tax=Gordonia prachuapensis TaxID=3115651 RepID=A0ABU7MTJ7_9ACTN|nr:metalloregulator ArsR/SmtB family transcription factor [Gordonia sp. PKS22-38]
MDQVVSALGDNARWRLVELLAERPRSVGELAGLTGMRQPQTTKHLQTLARAGLVTVFPLGQRRVYALEAQPLRDLRERVDDLISAVEAHAADREALANYRTAIDREAAAAVRPHWADGRTYTFERELAAAPALVWQYWTDATLLESWWAPVPMTVAACTITPEPGGPIVVEFVDPEGVRYRSEGSVAVAVAPGRLVFELSVLDDNGRITFTGHYDLALTTAGAGTRLRLELSISATETQAAQQIAGIETGWGQVLDNLAAAIRAGDSTTHTDTKGARS